MSNLTKEQRRQIAADEVKDMLREMREAKGNLSPAIWRNTVLMYGVMELMLRHGKSSSKGLAEICEREGFDMGDD